MKAFTAIHMGIHVTFSIVEVLYGKLGFHSKGQLYTDYEHNSEDANDIIIDF